MTMTTTQAVITIAAVVLGTMATRFIPFMIFPEGKKSRRNLYNILEQYFHMPQSDFSLSTVSKMSRRATHMGFLRQLQSFLLFCSTSGKKVLC